MILAILLVLGGILFLFWGAHQLLRSSVQIALIMGISPLVIGLTLVAFATSLPEALTSIIAQIEKVPGDIALGNVLGSNIANIGLVLGVGLLICPVTIRKRVKTIEIPFLIILSFLLGAIMLKGFVGRWAGFWFLLGAIGYLVFEWIYGKNGEAVSKNSRPIGRLILFFFLGVLALILGAKGLVDGGVRLARELHVPERIIALSVIAIGTSLPELFTVILAAIKKKEDLILGNVVGSNILNLLLIVGISALIRPIIFTHFMLIYDVPIMIGFAGLLWISMWRCEKLHRLYGGLYLFLYVGYLVFVGKW